MSIITAKAVFLLVIGAILALSPSQGFAVDEFEEPPIEYSKAEPKNAVSRLAEQVARGEKALAYDADFGYLKALLTELEVPESSQMLVFSKTSLQRQRISP